MGKFKTNMPEYKGSYPFINDPRKGILVTWSGPMGWRAKFVFDAEAVPGKQTSYFGVAKGFETETDAYKNAVQLGFIPEPEKVPEVPTTGS